MKDKNFKNLIFIGLSIIMLFAPLSRGAVRLWSITFVEGVVFTLVFLWFWKMNNHSGWAFKSTKLDIPIWGFVGLAVVSCIFGIYQYAGVLDILRLLTYVAVYYLIVNHFDWKLQFRFFWLIIAMGSALSLLAVGQCFFGLEHPWCKDSISSTYVNHAHFAGYLEMAMALNLGMLFGLNQDEVVSSFQLLVKRVLLAATLALMVTAFVLAQSRGGWVSFTFASLVLFVLLVKQKMISKWMFSAVLVCLFLFIIFLGFGEDRIAYRMHTIEVSEESRLMKGRVEIWESSFSIVKDNPMNGTGIGTFVWGFPKYRPVGLRSRYHYVHNDYIQMAVEMGVVVVPIFLWGIFVILQKGFDWDPKNFLLKRMMLLACGTGIFSLLVHGFVDFNFHIPANMLVFVSLTGIIMRKG